MIDDSLPLRSRTLLSYSINPNTGTSNMRE